MKQTFLFAVAAAAAAAYPLRADTSASPYGVCAHICKGEQWKLAEPKFKVLKPAGVRWVRNGFTWAQAEPSQGVWDYSKLDLVAATAKEHEIDILPILAYDVPWGHPTYQHLDKWREYVRRTVSRYAGQFRYWEVWNEANIAEAPGPKLEPEQYVQVLKAAAEEIRKIDPKLTILFTGTSGVPVPYIEECLKLGAADYFDVLNIHPYVRRNADSHGGRVRENPAGRRSDRRRGKVHRIFSGMSTNRSARSSHKTVNFASYFFLFLSG